MSARDGERGLGTLAIHSKGPQRLLGAPHILLTPSPASCFRSLPKMDHTHVDNFSLPPAKAGTGGAVGGIPLGFSE